MPGFSRIVLPALLALLCDPGRATPQNAPDPGIAGSYRRVGPANVLLRASTRDGMVQVRIEGGGPPASNGAVPADCIVDAAGTLRERLLTATFGPVATPDFSYTGSQAKTENRRLVIAFAPGVADVREADTDGYCGLGIDFRGRYRKVG